MITAQYKRDLNHNYLILPLEEGAAASYQLQMITKNKIEGLLACRMKMAEEGAACYYEISSKQSLRHIFMTSEMNYRELKNLLTGIYMILQRMENYLLDSKCLVLEPEYVYMDTEQGKVWLTYLPGYEDGSFSGIKHMAEFILSKVNHKDEAAAELAYYLYQYTKEENFSFRHVADYIEKQRSSSEAGTFGNKESLYKETTYAYKGSTYTDAACKGRAYDDENLLNETMYGKRLSRGTEYGKKPQSDSATVGLESCRPDAVMEYDNLYADESENGIKEPTASWEVMKNRLLFFCMGATILIIAVCVYVFMNYYLSSQIKTVGAGVIAVFYAAFAILYRHMYRNYKNTDEENDKENNQDNNKDNKKKNGNQKKNNNNERRREAFFRQEMPDEAYVNPYISDMPYENRYTSESDTEEAENEEYGNTVFFGSGMEADMREHYLEGECRGSKIHYEINKKQITIGKMKGKVDIALNDTSVSRIHAGICKKENKVLLTDLNSTNGTYKNGVMLQPGEVAELESGDELRFGKICLMYH